MRHSQDFGALVLCDERFQHPDQIKSLSSWIRPFVSVCSSFGDAHAQLTRFFKDVCANSELRLVAVNAMKKSSEIQKKSQNKKNTLSIAKQEWGGQKQKVNGVFQTVSTHKKPNLARESEQSRDLLSKHEHNIRDHKSSTESKHSLTGSTLNVIDELGLSNEYISRKSSTPSASGIFSRNKKFGLPQMDYSSVATNSTNPQQSFLTAVNKEKRAEKRTIENMECGSSSVEIRENLKKRRQKAREIDLSEIVRSKQEAVRQSTLKTSEQNSRISNKHVKSMESVNTQIPNLPQVAYKTKIQKKHTHFMN